MAERLKGLLRTDAPASPYTIGDIGTLAPGHSFGGMHYIDRDLVLAERDVSALENFIAEQQTRLSRVELRPEERRQLDDLREQLMELLEVQRSRYRKIWTAIHLTR